MMRLMRVHHAVLLSALTVIGFSGCGKSAPSDAAQESSPASQQHASSGTTSHLLAPSAVADKPPVSVTQVPLSLSRPVTTRWPVSSGVPFPRAAVTSLAHLQLKDAAGSVIPAQFAGLARWPDGSYKSVLVTFLADPGSEAFQLESDPAVAPSTPATPLQVADSPKELTVTTGPLRFTIGKDRFTLFRQAWADANADGQFTDNEAILTAPADIFLTDAKEGGTFRVSLDPHPRIEVEEAGPLRIVIRAAGSLHSDKGKKLTDYIIRLYAYAGQDTVQVDYSLVDTREERDVEAERSQLALAVSGYGIELPVKLPSATGLFAGEGGQVFAGPSEGSPYLYQSGEMRYVDGSLQPFDFSFEGIAQGRKADGWMDLSNEQKGVAVIVRKFWQQFPKELAIDDGKMLVWLHPQRASGDRPDVRYPANHAEDNRYRRPNTFYFPREGGAKTYQMLLQFHKGPGQWATIRDLARTFDDPPRALASAAWYCQSGVFGDLLEAGPWSEGYEAWLHDGVYQRSIGDHLESGSLSVLFGWRDYGDRMRPGWAGVRDNVKIPGFYNDTHIGAHIYFIQYLRSLDPIWWDIGEMATRHWMDIDVSHANRLGYWKDHKGKPVGFGPGEAHVIKHEMIDHECRNLHGGHAHLSGLPDYYLLTGDRRALEVMREVGDWWSNAAPVLFGTPVGKPHWAEAERDYAWPLFTLNEAYRGTGDPKYHQAAAQIVKHLTEWWQTPSEHYVNGQLVGKNDWKQGTGWWYMYPRQDNSPEPPHGKTLYNGTNPWMAGPLIASVIHFMQDDKDYGLRDAALMQEMALQTMNFVVKYGWEADKWMFIYSEAARDTGGNANLIIYALAYLARVYKAGGLAHPEWYDTAPKWMDISLGFYDDWKAVKDRGTTDMGFYGYEMIFTPEFFTIMHGLEAPAEAEQPADASSAVPATQYP